MPIRSEVQMSCLAGSTRLEADQRSVTTGLAMMQLQAAKTRNVWCLHVPTVCIYMLF